MSQKPTLVVFLVAFCFPVFLSTSYALVCSCNDDSTLSYCRWEEWTCTKDSSSHSCFSRLNRLDDGSIRHDLGCVNIMWNTQFCGRVSETVVTECCNEDHCNDNLTPTFLQPAISSTAQPPSPHTVSVGSPPPTLSFSTNGSGAPTFSPTPTPTILSNDKRTGSSLIHSDIEPVIGGICCSCYFTTNSTARGCALMLYDSNTLLNFDILRGPNNGIAVLECFTVPNPGLFHVAVREILEDMSKDSLHLTLSDVRVVPAHTCNTSEQANAKGVVTGLSVSLSLALIVLLMAALAVCLLLVRNEKIKENKTTTISNPPNDTKAVVPYAVKIVEESHAREADNLCEEKLLEYTGENFAS